MKKALLCVLLCCVVLFTACSPIAGNGIPQASVSTETGSVVQPVSNVLSVEFMEYMVGTIAHVTFVPMEWDSFTDMQCVEVIKDAIYHVETKAGELGVQYENTYGEYEDGTVLFHGTGNGFSVYRGNDFLEIGNEAARYLDVVTPEPIDFLAGIYSHEAQTAGVGDSFLGMELVALEYSVDKNEPEWHFRAVWEGNVTLVGTIDIGTERGITMTLDANSLSKLPYPVSFAKIDNVREMAVANIGFDNRPEELIGVEYGEAIPCEIIISRYTLWQVPYSGSISLTIEGFSVL